MTCSRLHNFLRQRKYGKQIKKTLKEMNLMERREYHKEHYSQNKETHLKYQRKWYEKMKADPERYAHHLKVMTEYQIGYQERKKSTIN